MNKYLALFVLSVFLSQSAAAEEKIVPAAGNENLPIITSGNETDDDIMETNAFGYPDKNLVTIIENTTTDEGAHINPKPDCHNAKLVSEAQAVLQPYIDTNAQTISDKRKIKLVLKNIDNFTPLDIKQVGIEQNPIVAARMIELKINNRLSEQNIKICQSDNPVLSAKIYLIMYDDGDNVKVEILNFANKTIPSFIFSKD